MSRKKLLKDVEDERLPNDGSFLFFENEQTSKIEPLSFGDKNDIENFQLELGKLDFIYGKIKLAVVWIVASVYGASNIYKCYKKNATSDMNKLLDKIEKANEKYIDFNVDRFLIDKLYYAEQMYDFSNSKLLLNSSYLSNEKSLKTNDKLKIIINYRVALEKLYPEVLIVAKENLEQIGINNASELFDDL